MAHEDTTDPHPAGPSRFLGRTCSFDYGSPPQRLFGMVESAHYIGRTARGAIPDYSLSLRGASGRLVEVTLVESRAVFSD
jgi:hypothetical protein